MQRLFTYGTLCPGRENAHILADIDGQWCKAFVKGVVHVLDWGPDRGLTAIVLDQQADKVAGYLLSSEELEAHWPHIDAFEGFQYQRVEVEVELESGELLRAWIYVMQPKPDSA